ncbi:MAG: glycosyltransferase family 2 protein [Patescibacteria group bacterium]
MKIPQVSIVMATHNRAHLVGKAIQSVQSQSFKDWELIIADDGSSDDTPSVVEEWKKKESRIVYTRSAINEGISKNYNRAFRIVRGEYIAMIDDDDPWLDKNKLQKQIEFLEKNSDYVGCGGGVVVINPQGHELYRYFKPETDAEIRKYMLFSNPMANSTTMFRKSAGEKVGWYDETTRYSGDRDFWLKMGLSGKLYNFPEYFSYYTMGVRNTSILKIRPHLRASLIIMRRYKGKYPNYVAALALNFAQYGYSFLPEFVRRVAHKSLARLKRLVVK